MTYIGSAQLFNERFYIVIKQLNFSEESKQNALHLLVDYLHGYALALNCQPSEKVLTVDMLDGQLSLYFLAFESI
ncbi:MAG: hypothetical protein ACJA0H_002167 [Francisellaceae bacterium]|jgi:hypothetical protein